MVILGIDPGVATIGFGVINAECQKNTLIQYGTITTPAGIPLASRLLQISNDMEELIFMIFNDFHFYSYVLGIETAACIGGGFYVLKVYKFTIT